jgi:hypothetical protein
MYEQAELTSDIEKVIETLEKEGAERLSPDVITSFVMTRWQEVAGDADERYLFASHWCLREQVRKRLNRYKVIPGTDVDEQLLLEGFERLQKRYLVEENGEQVAVRIEKMTRKQFEDKIAEFESMREGLSQHIQELRRYMNEQSRFD